MQLMCEGETEEVGDLLKRAPAFVDKPEYLDYRLYNFSVISKDSDLTAEDKVCSPLAIAVNVGDLRMVSIILKYLCQIEINRGLVVKAKENSKLKAKLFQSTRLKSPL